MRAPRFRPSGFLVLALFFGFHAADSHARSIPVFKGPVIDEVGLLSSSETQAIETRLRQLLQTQRVAMAILIAQTLGDDTLEGFSIRVAEQWKLGEHKSDRGIVFLIVPQARKLRLEIGYGLEGMLPDLLSRRILDEEAVPAFRDQEYAAGILQTIDRVSVIVGNQSGSKSLARPHIPVGKRRFPIALLLALAWITIIFLTRRMRPSGRTLWSSNRSWRHEPPTVGWGGGWGGGSGGGGFSGGGNFGGGGASSSW
jgi:uncharacterized protein